MDEKKQNNPFRPISEPRNCSECGKPMKYTGRGSYTCEVCGKIEYDDFGRVDQYLEAHGPSSAPVMSRALGIPIGKIHDLVAQGRLEPIPNGRKSLDSLIYDSVVAPEETLKRMGTYIPSANQHEDDRMRYLQPKKPSSH